MRGWKQRAGTSASERRHARRFQSSTDIHAVLVPARQLDRSAFSGDAVAAEWKDGADIARDKCAGYMQRLVQCPQRDGHRRRDRIGFTDHRSDERKPASRPQRKGKDGRVYTMQLACSDPVTNLSGTKSVTVTVPHDQGGR